MYGLSNGTNTSDLELAWRSLLALRLTKCVAWSICNSRASCYGSR